MECPYCGAKTVVVNSRRQKRNNQVWRRRKCLNCNSVFTTHEFIDYSAVFTVNNRGKLQPFYPQAILGDLLNALRGRHNAYNEASELSGQVMRNIFKKRSKAVILPQMISQETALVLKRFNRQAWLRYVAEHPSQQ